MVYYIDNNDQIYDICELPDGDKVRDYIINNYTEITYNEFMKEYETEMMLGGYYPEVRGNFNELEYKAHLFQKKVKIEVNSKEYNEILRRIK